MATTQSTPVFILAGGKGTRISEETQSLPKPMIEIGDIPVLIHLMRWYYSKGFTDFVICAGYKAWEIKQYFLNYSWRSSHVELDMRDSNAVTVRPMAVLTGHEKWRVRVIDTGLECQTGGRVARAFDVVSKVQKIDQFAVTYGDGLSDIDLGAEFDFHKKHGKIGTVLGVHPLARFGELDIVDGTKVQAFLEKPQARQGVINGGFFFFNSSFRKYLSDADECILEREPVTQLASEGELQVYKHEGFWHPMDMLRDKQALQKLWESGKAPWLAKA